MNIRDIKCSKCGAKGNFWERENKLDCKLCGQVNDNPNKGEVPTLRPQPLMPPVPNGKVPIYCNQCFCAECKCEEIDPFMYYSD